MKTETEILAVAHSLALQEIAFDLFDWTGWTEAEQRRALLLACYEISYGESGPRKKAASLFRKWLSVSQRRELSRNGSLRFLGSAGGTYRIIPGAGRAERIEKHGKNWYRSSVFCLHSEVEMPKADDALAHFLFLISDEPGFLAAANEHPHVSMQWDGSWRRRLNESRQRDAAHIQADETALREANFHGPYDLPQS
jgi:hypothetical protein